MDNNNLGLKHYVEMKDATLSDLLIQASIKNENQLMVFSDFSWKDCTDTGISTGAYIIFHQGGPIDHGTHVTGQVYQSSAESEYNAECTAGMVLAHFRMLINEMSDKDPYIVTEAATIFILDRKYAVCMAKNVKNTKNTRNIYRRVNFVRNCENVNIKRLTGVKEVWNWQTL